MPITIYHYKGCSTCRNALRWLAAEGLEVEAVDIVGSPPTAAQLGEWQSRSGLPLKRFFNTSGMSYRNGGFSARLPDMSEREQLEALAADGKLIKRPLLVADDAVLVGFKPAEYAAALSR